MPEYLSPGVYTEEIDINGKPIEGVSTSTAGFIGETERGPTDPRLITGFTQYEHLYGDYAWTSGSVASEKDKTDAAAAKTAADNAARAAKTAATKAATDASKAKDRANQAGATEADKTAAEQAKAAADKAAADSTAADQAAAAAAALVATQARGPQPSSSFLPYAVAGFFANGGQRCYVGRVVGKHAETAEVTLQGGGVSINIAAVGPGTWGNRIALAIQKASSVKPNETTNEVFKLVVYYWSGKPPTLESLNPPPDRKQFRDADDKEPRHEVFDDLNWDPKSPQFVLSRLHKQSHLIEASRGEIGAGAAPVATPGDKLVFLSGGADGGEIDYEGTNGEDEPVGLAAFEEQEEISIVCIPDQAKGELYDRLNDALVTHCEKTLDRFGILQAKIDEGDIGDLYPAGGKVDSKYAAFYYPWIKIYDPAASMPRLIPPGGHIAGIYARSDIERGVHKAPANERVNGALDLQFNVTKGEQDVLNPRGVNCIRSFLGRGILVWGARTTSDDPAWIYVNVRRLFIFLEKSIQRSTQWVVFEPNNEALWARLVQGVSDWLTSVWRDGALLGKTAEEAFFVKCDRTTMTENDIETGRLVMIIGVAPTRPAEFVIFRLAQWRSGSEITE